MQPVSPALDSVWLSSSVAGFASDITGSRKWYLVTRGINYIVASGSCGTTIAR